MHRTYKTELMNMNVKKTVADKRMNIQFSKYKLSVTIIYFRKKKKTSIFLNRKFSSVLFTQMFSTKYNLSPKIRENSIDHI